MKNIILLFLLILLASCKKGTGQINLPHSEFASRVHDLRIYSDDTVVFESKIPFSQMEGDTLKFRNLPSGAYKMSYLDLFGKVKIDDIILKSDTVILAVPRPDAVNINSFYAKTPISNIKDGQHYIIHSKGGCVATMESWYTIYKEKERFYFEPARGKKKLLDKNQIEAEKQFEAELLAIEGVDICSSTGRMTYSIIQDRDTIKIVDNTCMWQGWGNLMHKLYKE